MSDVTGTPAQIAVQALARIEALEAEVAISSGLRDRVAELETQVRELQGWREVHNSRVHGFPVEDNVDNAPDDTSMRG